MTEDINKVLNKFAKDVIRDAKKNLVKHNNRGTLRKSLTSEVNVSKNSIQLSFYGEEYASYLDRGVKGADPSLVGGVQKAPNAPFKFTNKRPPLKNILAWVKQRKIRLRKKDGTFAKGGYKSSAFVIQKSIYAQGIKPSLFLTKPFEKYFKDLPDDVVEAYGLNVTDFITQKFRNENK